MIDSWYYWQEAAVLGPYTGRELADLAAAGTILPTDTVWREGVEEGVQASRVRNLFALPAAVEVVPTPVAPPVEVVRATTPDVAPGWSSAQAIPNKLRAVAGKGTIIVGQDGKTVKFRKKCTTCGYEDSSWKCVPITRGTSRHTFYCPKCRKGRQVEIQGM